ncbi:uncharacterized protein si:dkey-225f5.4 [Gadus macrocephalus]|uniref:uncharacterized protein si:dkey-225f5.4 n=1 Tax=Gadus macrocephalus TaxID=80720 RepID=UPI0028CBB8DD|nr:uncharacterized protein si:dkey-225f5.4 [Gadus macrocephalus]
MATVQSVLERCDPAFLDLYGDPEQSEYVEADRMLLQLIDNRRIKKVLWRQMSVFDSMLSDLEGSDSLQQLLTQSFPPKPDSKACSRWKALKAETRLVEEEIEVLIDGLLTREEQIVSKRLRLVHLVKELTEKKHQSKKLEMALQKSYNALHVCDGQLAILKAESEAAVNFLDKWQKVAEELRGCTSATKDLMQTKLLQSNQSELVVEQRPLLAGGQVSNDLLPLKLSITWCPDDRFKLQVNQGKAGLEENCMKGRLSELPAAMLEVRQRYSSQGDMLGEIQTLHSSFAIDWRPAQKLLVYLKSASVVCSLEVEEGYPRTGHACLVSIRRDAQPIDTSMLQPPKKKMSLTEWLVFLSTSPLV